MSFLTKSIIIYFNNELFESNTALSIKPREHRAEQGSGRRGLGAKGSFARAIQGNKMCENETKQQLESCIRVSLSPPSPQETNLPKIPSPTWLYKGLKRVYKVWEQPMRP